MALDVQLLRDSFNLVVERQPDVVHRFYDILFTRYPAARPMFHRKSRESQEKMLTEALVAVMDHLEDAPWLTSTLGALGAKHVNYGVTPEMYGWVGECLLATLAEVAAADWTPRHQAAWAEAYGAIAQLMLKGATPQA
jgi:hemoglobin-like flavoprotein